MKIEERRRAKYPDTSTFHYYNANPKNKIGGDCVVRAICTALNQSWEQTVREMTELGIKKGLVLNDKNLFPEYLKQKGWIKKQQPKKLDGTKYTGKEFCKWIQKQGGQQYKEVIANIGGHHTVAIICGEVGDIWDCTDKTIGNYWIHY